jgi:signal transduction histidine kinase
VIVDSVVQGQENLCSRAPAQVVLSPDKEQLEIHFTSLNLATPEHARRYRYRLENHEATWVDAGSTPVVRYPKLPPGQYRFVVSAANEDGVWNQTGAVLAVIVQPPYWRTWWFLSASFLALLGAVVGSVHLISTAKLRREMRQQKALEIDRSRIARDLHDQLGASMTQLSLLAEMIEADKDLPGEVEAHAQQITRTANHTTHTLDEIVWAVNPANDTLNGLINYICKNAQDYLHVAGLKYRFDVPAQIPEIPLAPEVRHNVFLAAKEAITNVVRHSKGTGAWIRLRLAGERFALEIADDGTGTSPTARESHRNGLRNMSKRMEDVGGTFSLGRAPEGGTLVTLSAPLGKRKP